jgi:hypothetical protein
MSLENFGDLYIYTTLKFEIMWQLAMWSLCWIKLFCVIGHLCCNGQFKERFNPFTNDFVLCVCFSRVNLYATFKFQVCFACLVIFSYWS